MPSTRDIRRRIKSVKSTAQITKAMQMVAASKMRRAQQAALAGRPYAALMNEVLASVGGLVSDFSHPFLQKRETIRKKAVIFVSTDKGLCGGLNSNLAREATRSEKGPTAYICAGKKGAQFIARTKRELTAEFTYKDTPLFAEARAISKFAQELYLEEKVDQVDVLYTNFISTLNQKPIIRQLLPIIAIEPAIPAFEKEAPVPTGPEVTEYLFEPGPAQVLGALLPHYLNYQVYQILLEAKASEHSSRMVAMKNATDNAKQLIKDLTLEYNKLRQANITKELLEITSAAMAMG
jgi:F-type H+-transporting ATPase subunit gamma